jgi:hypothetical protein
MTTLFEVSARLAIQAGGIDYLESISWNLFPGSINVYRFGLSTIEIATIKYVGQSIQTVCFFVGKHLCNFLQVFCMNQPLLVS